MMRHWNKKGGFTLLEILAASAVASLLLIGTVSMLVAAMRSCDNDLAQVNTDTNAVIAMNQMVNEIREAKSIGILDPGPSTGSRLCVTMPVTLYDTDGNPYYDRNQADTADQITYYLSDTSGIVGKPGTILWRSQNGGIRRIRNDVSSLVFEEDADLNNQIDNAIMITVVTTDSVYKGTRQTQLTDRVVYLRNYSKNK